MNKSKIIIDQIECDMYNIQTLVDMLPFCKKTHYNRVQNQIKNLVKEIRYQKNLISEKVFKKHFRHTPALFEVEPSELPQIDINTITSFFGVVD